MMTQPRTLSVPEYVLTTSSDPKVGHLTKSPSLEEVQNDRDRLKAAFPYATLWKRLPDGTMQIVDGGRYE